MSSFLETICQLEMNYGHNEIFNGVNDEQEATEKISIVINTLKLMMEDNDRISETAMQSISRLISAHALSPECMAFLLTISFSDDEEIYRILAEMYKRRSMEDQAVFQAVYFARKYEKAYKDTVNVSRYEIVNDHYRRRYGSQKRDQFVGKCAVYTVITGGYDTLRDPEYINPDWDYYCFTDSPEEYESAIWKIKKLNKIIEMDTSRTQRYAKTHPFVLLPEYDYTVYVDGKMSISENLDEYINTFSRGCSMLCFPHPTRQYIEEELEALKSVRIKNPKLCSKMDEQVRVYKNSGYNNSVSLVETACLIRSNHDEALIEVMEDWWKEIQIRSDRDQLSLGYVCWKHDYQFDISALNIYNNKYLKHHPHNA